MPISSSLGGDITDYGRWLHHTCYDKYSPGHALLLQTVLTNEFYHSFNLVQLEKEVKK